MDARAVPMPLSFDLRLVAGGVAAAAVAALAAWGPVADTGLPTGLLRGAGATASEVNLEVTRPAGVPDSVPAEIPFPVDADVLAAEVSAGTVVVVASDADVIGLVASSLAARGWDVTIDGGSLEATGLHHRLTVEVDGDTATYTVTRR